MSARFQLNSRAARVREYLLTVKTARSPREILNAVEPGGDLQKICWTLCSMAQRGQVEQIGKGKGKVRFRAGVMSATITRDMLRKQTRPAPAARRVPASTHFTAAPGTVDHSFDPQRQASARIAADIAEFERRGGRIEQLGTTVLFHDIDVANDDE